MLSLLLSICISSASASVFDEIESVSAQGISFAGQVKLIAVNNEDIKIKMTDSDGQEQIFKFCPQANFSANDPAVKTKLDLLNEAFKTGKTVQISYRSVFDRCLESVEMAANQLEAHK